MNQAYKIENLKMLVSKIMILFNNESENVRKLSTFESNDCLLPNNLLEKNQQDKFNINIPQKQLAQSN
jgi:hypothetical protein